MTTLRLILGDQLNRNHSWFQEQSPDILYCLFEMRQETDYARHHVQKVVGFFAAMRSFRDWLIRNEHNVVYWTLNHPDNTQNLVDNLRVLVERQGVQRLEVQLPDEYRLDQQLIQMAREFDGEFRRVDTEHFLTERETLKTHFQGKKTYVLEGFYRMMRRKYDVLMEGKQPATGQWNYDKNNRKKLPKNHQVVEPPCFSHDVREIQAMLMQEGVHTIGTLDAMRFIWPINPQEAEDLLQFFISEALPQFGDFQDAMSLDDWSLYHCRLSFAMNTKMLHPMRVIRAVENAWREDPERVSISQAEGFIRQVLGWREYMRGVYWAKMPGYAELNFLGHTRTLPSWYWTGQTKMNCLQKSIKQSLKYAYAHHIQRLMVTGNFALLAGVHPDEVDAWYLGIYIDAIEWVEITNTRGMSQFADGGIVGSKPYVSSANYMHRQGPYCTECEYDRKDKFGPRACPFNTLYWHFYVRHRALLERNPRVGMVYRTWDKMDEVRKQAVLARAEEHLEAIEHL